MKFATMDVTDMTALEAGSIDVAVDKSTIDALMCTKGSSIKVAQMLNQVQRLLKVGGHYVAISYGKPESRSFVFD
jgi:hypothetical protein